MGPAWSVPLGPNNRYDIILPDGPVLECTAMGRSWVYTLGGREVMKASISRVNGERKVFVTRFDTDVAGAAVLLSCLERCADRYVSASTTTPMIISAIGLALLRQATMNNNIQDF